VKIEALLVGVYVYLRHFPKTKMHFDSCVSCVVITKHRTPSIVIGQNPFMDWGSIPLENILLYNFNVLASFELVIMVLWNA